METQSGDPVSGDARVGNYYYLPRGMVRVVGEVNQGAYKITISRFNVPDVRKRYFLKQNMNAFFDDHTVLEVNEQGLLTTTNVDSEDKTPAVIDKVVETVVSVAKISAHLGQRVLLDDTGAVVGPLPFNCTFDPLNATQVAAARGKVSAAGFELQVSDGGGEQAKDPLPGDKLSGRGVFYRPPRLVDVSISAKAKDKPVLEQTVVRVPDPNQVAVLDLGRPFLVKKTTNLEFVGGDLKKVDYHKPSEALAAVSIPASILAKVADAIPSIIQIQDSRANAALK